MKDIIINDLEIACLFLFFQTKIYQQIINVLVQGLRDLWTKIVASFWFASDSWHWSKVAKTFYCKLKKLSCRFSYDPMLQTKSWCNLENAKQFITPSRPPCVIFMCYDETQIGGSTTPIFWRAVRKTGWKDIKYVQDSLPALS